MAVVRDVVRGIVRPVVNSINERYFSWSRYWTPQSAEIMNEMPDKVLILFNHNIDENSIPDISAFTLAGKTITSVVIIGAIVVLTISVTYVYGDIVTVSYVKPVTNPLINVKSFSNLSVTNNISLLLSDTFTGSDNTRLNVHTMDKGAGWTEAIGTWNIISNKARQILTTGLYYYSIIDAGSGDIDCSLDITMPLLAKYIMGITFRYIDDTHNWDTHIQLDTDSANPYIYLGNSGGFVASVVQVTKEPGVARTLRVVAFGELVTVYWNGVKVIETTSSYNQTEAKVGLYSYNDAQYGVVLHDNFKAIKVKSVWDRIGIVLSSDDALPKVSEPCVIYESGVFKMWCSKGGWGVENGYIGYATSIDGITWVHSALNPIVYGFRPAILKYNGVYYLYVINGDGSGAGVQFDLYTSSDGVAFTLDTATILVKGGLGAWDEYGIENRFVWIENSTWYMLYEASGAIGGISRYRTGLATSSDGRSWTKDVVHNPVIDISRGSGRMWIRKIGSHYYCWIHNGGLPMQIYRMRSTDLFTWTEYPAIDSVFIRKAINEGLGSAMGQVVDPFMLEYNNKVYLFYNAQINGTNPVTAGYIKMAITDMPITKLVLTNEDIV